MRILKCLVVMWLVLGTGAAGAAGLTGTYTRTAQGLTLTLILGEDGNGNLSGTLSTSAGMTFQLQGNVAPDGLGAGICFNEQGALFFQARPDQKGLVLALTEPDASNRPDFSTTRNYSFLRQDTQKESGKTSTGKASDWGSPPAVTPPGAADLARIQELNEQVVKYFQAGRYPEAIAPAEELLSKMERFFGPDKNETAVVMGLLAELYRAVGEYGKAEPLLKKALDVKEKTLGPEHRETAAFINNLAMLYDDMGKPDQAGPLYRKALAIREKVLGPDHPEVAGSLNNLASLLQGRGDYDQAVPLLQRAREILEKAGPSHTANLAATLNNLAFMYKELGDYVQAEPLYQQALSIREKSLGTDHPDVALSLDNLGVMYTELGHYDQAERLHLRAIAIWEKALGPDHPEVAFGLNNLAELYRVGKDYDRAEPLYKRALAIREKVLGPGHPRTGQIVNNLAALYHLREEYARAEPLYRRALGILEETKGVDHPDVAVGLNNLAALYRDMSDLARAEPLYRRALAIWEKSLGLDHPSVALCLNNLATLKGAADDFSGAFELMKRVRKIEEGLIERVMGIGSEERKLNFLATQEKSLHAFLGLIMEHLVDDPGARRQALDVWLRRKGIVLEAQQRFQEALVYSDSPEARAVFRELARVRSSLSRLAFSNVGRNDPLKYKSRIAELEAQKDELEARLSKLSREFGLQRKRDRADAASVARALPAGSVLIELARIGVYNFKYTGDKDRWFPDRYLAFVLHPGRTGRVGMVDLGRADIIDAAVAHLKKMVLDDDENKVLEIKGASRKLYYLVFAPLEKKLGGAREIFISPDGNLNLIPFEIMLDSKDRYLIDTYTFNYLAAGREVLGFQRGAAWGRRGKVVLMGDPAYDLGRRDKSATLGRLAVQNRPTEEKSSRASEMRGIRFTPLPGTREEVRAIQGILGKKRSEVYTGAEALEEVLLGLESPEILHLATHGFFLRDRDPTGRRGSLSSGGPEAGAKGGAGVADDALLRSGLALAGANNAMKSSDLNRTDGILTAEKVLALRLRGTGLVVLSACQTGLGEVKSGEGVFGLRRAFAQAGGKSLVMSMWSVPDLETKELMIEFYRNLASGRMSRSRALREAMVRQKQITRERYGHTNPLYWGAFVFLGQP